MSAPESQADAVRTRTGRAGQDQRGPGRQGGSRSRPGSEPAPRWAGEGPAGAGASQTGVATRPVNPIYSLALTPLGGGFPVVS